MPVGARLIRLARDGTCEHCSRGVVTGEMAWWTRGKPTVTCLVCLPAAGEQALQIADTLGPAASDVLPEASPALLVTSDGGSSIDEGLGAWLDWREQGRQDARQAQPGRHRRPSRPKGCWHPRKHRSPRDLPVRHSRCRQQAIRGSGPYEGRRWALSSPRHTSVCRTSIVHAPRGGDEVAGGRSSGRN